jgi:hypothetical protein
MVQHLEELKTKDRFGEEEETVNKIGEKLLVRCMLKTLPPEAKEK